MRTLSLLSCLAVAASADTERLVVSISDGVAPVTELRGAARATSEGLQVVAEEAEDLLALPEEEIAPRDVDAIGSEEKCMLAESYLQKMVEFKCNLTKVSCVYKLPGNCTDWCTPSTECGYVQDNPFVKFHDYECRDLPAVLLKEVNGTVMCKPEFTPAGVGALSAAVLAMVGCCCCCTWWCCCRRRR